MTKAKIFENCLIYKLVCLDTTYHEVYIGSTTCFKQRKYQHKSNCYNEKCKEYNFKVYQYIREHGGFGNFAMVEIEKYPCENGRQLEAREEHWRKELGATLNGNRAFSTDEEKRVQVKEGGVKFNNRNPTYRKDYREANKETLLQKKKAYRQANKAKINLYNKEYRLRKKLEKLNQKIPETNIIEN